MIVVLKLHGIGIPKSFRFLYVYLLLSSKAMPQIWAVKIVSQFHILATWLSTSVYTGFTRSFDVTLLILIWWDLDGFQFTTFDVVKPLRSLVFWFLFTNHHLVSLACKLCWDSVLISWIVNYTKKKRIVPIPVE